MKSKLLLGFLIVLAAATFSSLAFVIWPAFSIRNIQVASQPDQVVRDFYDWYLSYDGNPIVEHAYRSNRRLSPEMIAFLDGFTREGMSYDPLLCAQDKPTNIRAAPARVSGWQASAEVVTSFANHGFSVELIYQNGDWLIDKVNCRP